MGKKEVLFLKISAFLSFVIIVGLLFVIRAANYLLVKLNYVVD